MFENVYKLGRGTICVVRVSEGMLQALKIQNRASFKEWVGCFSIL
jgi:hypothetical protein